MADSAADGIASGTTVGLWSHSGAQWIICEAADGRSFVQYCMRSFVQVDWLCRVACDENAYVRLRTWTTRQPPAVTRLATEQECHDHRHREFAWMRQEMDAYRQDRDKAGPTARLEREHRDILTIFREAMRQRTGLYQYH